MLLVSRQRSKAAPIAEQLRSHFAGLPAALNSRSVCCGLKSNSQLITRGPLQLTEVGLRKQTEMRE